MVKSPNFTKFLRNFRKFYGKNTDKTVLLVLTTIKLTKLRKNLVKLGDFTTNITQSHQFITNI